MCTREMLVRNYLVLLPLKPRGRERDTPNNNKTLKTREKKATGGVRDADP